mmetsp:Transcript_11267/g.19574  ORF Transcript_11267/g.19574 Transcript_11267/m.19574 type:complete len:588 (-) Transcript_11267:50-1813(-)
MGIEVPESATAENPDLAEEPTLASTSRLRGRAQTWANDGARVLGSRANMRGVVRAAREPRKPKRRLANITEQRVLKQGICRLNSLVVREGIDLLELPRRPDGTPRLLRPKFFERLLSNEVTLQTSMPNDIAAAQSDLKHLRLEQLLAIRISTLDFATASQSHDAHNNFLNTLDKSLFEYTARQHFRNGSTVLPSAPEPLYRLGLQMCLVLGVASIMQDGIAESNGNSEHAPSSLSPPSPSAVPLPARWALPVEAGKWPDDLAAVLFDIAFLGLEPVHSETVVATSGGESIAVIHDRTTGVGKDRILHWEVAVVDPAKEDFFLEFQRAQRAGGGGREKAQTMGQELHALLARRKMSEAAEPHDGVEKATGVSKRRITFDISAQKASESVGNEDTADMKPEPASSNGTLAESNPDAPAAGSNGTAAGSDASAPAGGSSGSAARSITRSSSPQMPPLPSTRSLPQPSASSVPSAQPQGRARALTAPASVDLFDTGACEVRFTRELPPDALQSSTSAAHEALRSSYCPPRRMTVAVVPAMSQGSRRCCGPMPLPPAAAASRTSTGRRTSGIAPLPPPRAEEFSLAQQAVAK